MRVISANDINVLVLTGIISAVVGGSGITGLVFYFIRGYIDRRLTAKLNAEKVLEEQRKKEEEKKKALRIKRMSVDDELQHCQGRLFFWIHKAIVDGRHNGDLESAFENYQRAEEKKKLLDREIIAENEIE